MKERKPPEGNPKLSAAEAKQRFLNTLQQSQKKVSQLKEVTEALLQRVRGDEPPDNTDNGPPDNDPAGHSPSAGG